MKGYKTYGLNTEDIGALYKNCSQPMLGSYIFDLTNTSALTEEELISAIGTMTVSAYSIDTGTVFLKLGDDWSNNKIMSMLVPGLIKMCQEHVKHFAIVSDEPELPGIESHIISDIPECAPTTVPWFVRILDNLRK